MARHRGVRVAAVHNRKGWRGEAKRGSMALRPCHVGLRCARRLRRFGFRATDLAHLAGLDRRQCREQLRHAGKQVGLAVRIGDQHEHGNAVALHARLPSQATVASDKRVVVALHRREQILIRQGIRPCEPCGPNIVFR